MRETVPEALFRDLLVAELRWEFARLGRRPLGSIFFGGGTPSLMSPATVAALIDAATASFSPEPELEITLEANPGSVERSKLAGFRAAGVNRISLGIQALDDVALQALGRSHSAADAIAALELARTIFPRLSFDLIYARPDQQAAAWREELRRALSLAADHLSLYQLTIESGTVFEARYRRGELRVPDADATAMLCDLTTEVAEDHGLLAYEVSNYAALGAESRHNLAYWRYGDYAGIGPGAHGRLSFTDRLIATRRHRAPEVWAERVRRSGHGSHAEEEIAAADRAREMLLMGLRLAEGIDEARFARRTGRPLSASVEPDTLLAAVEAGYVERPPGRLRATPAGRRRLDALLPRLVR